MFDFSATEFLVIALVALIVIGPRELPGLLRQIGQMVGKVRRMASEFQEQLNTAVESSEIQEIKTEVGKLADEARIDMDYDPAIDAEREIRDAVAGKPSDKKAEIHNPDYGNDPDDALVEFPPADSDTASAAKPADKAGDNAGDKAEKRAGGSDNAIVREPSKPRAAASGKRLPVNAGNTSTADSVAAKTDNADGKQTSSEG